MKPLFDRDRHDEMCEQLHEEQAGDRWARHEAERPATEALRAVAVVLGLDVPFPVTRFDVDGPNAGEADPDLLEAADLRGALAGALAGALNYAAGRDGQGADGRDTEDDTATVISGMLAAASLFTECAARLQRLVCVPPER